ncbi:MAG: hypothetical protein IV090_18350 [Candidatus Sericytochromatia bacterium]|nr:hypothetical protein [Candidatus Sericytochromatia bacterium]
MKIFPIVLTLIFIGMIVLYVFIGRLGGGEQLQQDKALAAEMEGREALTQSRADLALLYFDKGLKALKETPTSPQLSRLWAGRGDALAALKRCSEAKIAWSEACKRGQAMACKAVCKAQMPAKQ